MIIMLSVVSCVPMFSDWPELFQNEEFKNVLALALPPGPWLHSSGSSVSFIYPCSTVTLVL